MSLALTYTKDIPDPPSSPSVDVPNMKVNTNSINTIWTRDHFTFESDNAGLHNRVQLVEINTALPVGLRNIGSGTLFTKISPSPLEGNLFFYRIGAGAAIQMTGPSSPIIAQNGSSFLPGGIMFQWGAVSPIVVGDNPISFNTVFPNAIYNIQITVVNQFADSIVTVKPLGVTTSGFIAVKSIGGTGTGIFWTAIGS